MSAETANDTYRAHSLSLNNRKTMKLTGVDDAITFDEKTVILETSFGRIEIGGEDLHIEVLNLKDGIVELSGRIDSIDYSSDEPVEHTKKSFFEKLFR